ncbi:hypothetical protein BS17DRAFT_769413 [Gyrodon lividus]|nr:hypothetical protein BS17DRAFT_769413 [Gyrodon lividus]
MAAGCVALELPRARKSVAGTETEELAQAFPNALDGFGGIREVIKGFKVFKSSCKFALDILGNDVDGREGADAVKAKPDSSGGGKGGDLMWWWWLILTMHKPQALKASYQNLFIVFLSNLLAQGSLGICGVVSSF